MSTTSKQTIYTVPSTKLRLSLRKMMDRIAAFLCTNNIYWTGIELEPSTRSGTLSPGTSTEPPAGKLLRIYLTDPEEPTAVSYLFQKSGFMAEQLPDGIDRIEFVKVLRDDTFGSPRERNCRRDSEEE